MIKKEGLFSWARNKLSLARNKVSLPVVVIILSLIYFLCTYNYFWQPEWVPVFNSDSASIRELIFGSPPIIKMFQATLFYLVPLFALTLFLFFLFSAIERIKFNVGGNMVEIERHIETTADQKIKQITKFHNQEMDMQTYQNKKIFSFSNYLLSEPFDMCDLLVNYIVYLKELFVKHDDVFFAFYFITDDEAKGIDFCGMNPSENKHFNMFIEHVADKKNALYINNLEKKDEDNTENDQICEVLGVPLLTPEEDILAITLVYTKDISDQDILTKFDQEALKVMSKLFQMGLNILKYKNVIEVINVSEIKEELKIKMLAS